MKRLLSLFTLLLVAGCVSFSQTPPPGMPASVAAPEIRTGDEWKYSFHDGYTRIPRGMLEYRVTAVESEIDGKVLGWERVKVPAGEFDALVVQRVVYAGNHDHFLSEEKITEIDWYAPRAGGIVRHSSRSGHLDTRIGCDRICNQWIDGGWNVVELVSQPRR